MQTSEFKDVLLILGRSFQQTVTDHTPTGSGTSRRDLRWIAFLNLLCEVGLDTSPESTAQGQIEGRLTAKTLAGIAEAGKLLIPRSRALIALWDEHVQHDPVETIEWYLQQFRAIDEELASSYERTAKILLLQEVAFQAVYEAKFAQRPTLPWAFFLPYDEREDPPRVFMLLPYRTTYGSSDVERLRAYLRTFLMSSDPDTTVRMKSPSVADLEAVALPSDRR